MGKSDISRYMYCLLSALKVVHDLQYIHRDVKPSNFLYNMNLKTGILIDFGLAQKAPSKMDCLNEINRLLKVPAFKGFSCFRLLNFYLAILAKSSRSCPGYLLPDTRPSIRASRAGTRGFRAPEVLFKVSFQTTGIFSVVRLGFIAI